MKRAAASKSPAIPAVPLRAVSVTETDLDWLLKTDKRLPANKRRLSFNTYGKSENDSTLFNRIMYRPSSSVESQRTNYVQCRVCNKILVAKLTGGSNPARHRKHCKGPASSSSDLPSERPVVETKKETIRAKSEELSTFGSSAEQRESTLNVLDRLAGGEIDDYDAMEMLEGKGAVAEFVRDLVAACGTTQRDQLGDEAVDLTGRLDQSTAGGTNSHSNNRSRASSVSNAPSPDLEHPAFAAYRIRQTYIFMRVQSTNKPVICKANDEDFFPPNRTNSTAADRAKLSAGQIITAFFGYNQIKTLCVVEAVGEWESVIQQFHDAIVQQFKEGRSSTPTKQVNGVISKSGDGTSSTLRRIFPQTETTSQNLQDDEEEDCLSPCSSESLAQSRAKFPRLDVPSMSHEEIARRFELLESRIRALEQRTELQSDQ